jgi:hypothetical protein
MMDLNHTHSQSHYALVILDHHFGYCTHSRKREAAGLMWATKKVRGWTVEGYRMPGESACYVRCRYSLICRKMLGSNPELDGRPRRLITKSGIEKL